MVHIIVNPASGSNFIAQLAILQHLCHIGYKPDLCLGSSGGNLSLYIASAADWNHSAILRITKELKVKYFAKPWHPIALVSHMIGFFNGNAFDNGEGLTDFLKSYFDKQTIQKYEIVTGTYNKDLQKIRLFSNRSPSSTFLKGPIDHDLTQSLPTYYMDGDFELIALSGLASASIPGLVPPKLIDGHYYSDGASSINSPMTILQTCIAKSLNQTDSLHITYVNCKDLSQATIIPHHNLFDTWKQAVNDLIKSQTLIDRLAAHELLTSVGQGELKKSSFPCSYQNLLEIVELRDKLKYSLLEIYPLRSSDIDITNFTTDDIERNMKMLYNECACHFWWYN